MAKACGWERRLAYAQSLTALLERARTLLLGVVGSKQQPEKVSQRSILMFETNFKKKGVT